MINQIKSLLFTDTGKDTVIVFAGTTISAIIGGIFFVIAPRILGPGDYGLFAVVVSTGLMVTSLANFGMDTGILRFVRVGENETNQKILKLALVAYLLIGILVGAGGFVFAPLISKILSNFSLTPLLRIAFSGVIFLLLTDFFIAVLQSRRQFIKSSLVNIISNVARLIFLGLGAYFFTLDVYLLTVLFFFIPIVSILVGKLFVPLDFLRAKNSKSELKNFFSFNFWIASAIAISSIPIDNYLLVKFAGPVATGIYAAPFKLISIADQLAGNFSRVLAPRFSSFRSHQDAKTYALKTIPILSVLFFVIAFGSVIAEPLVNLLLGGKYQESVNIFRILSLGFAFYFTNTTAVSLVIYYLGKSKEIFLITLIIKLSLFLTSIVLIMKFEELGAATAFLISGILSTLLFNVYAIWQLTKSNS